MSSPRTLLARVRKLEAEPVNPILRVIGSLDEFEAEIQQGIEGGRYDPTDMPLVANCFRRWVSEVPVGQA